MKGARFFRQDSHNETGNRRVHFSEGVDLRIAGSIVAFVAAVVSTTAVLQPSIFVLVVGEWQSVDHHEDHASHGGKPHEGRYRVDRHVP